MNFFKKIFNLSSNTERVAKNQEVNLSLEDSFVHNFIEKGGRFLYCTKKKEVISNLENIIKENNWKEIICVDENIANYIKDIDIAVKTDLDSSTPIFTTCEYLIADKGNILFSSNQLTSRKINSFSEYFVVYSTTSQLVKNIGQGLTGINANFKGNLPTNISPVKNYIVNKSNDNLLNYGSGNSKNLYLLLFEDL